MGTPESQPDDKSLIDIALRMQAGEPVGLQDQLRFFRFREHELSEKLKNGDINAFHPLEDIRGQIEAVNRQIMDSGDPGGGTTGQGSRHDAHNNPR
jgi:hypothetical protein